MVAGHRVLIALGNRLEFVTAYLGVLRAQAVAVPVNPSSTAGELARMIADSGSRLVVADADTVAAVREAAGAVIRALAGEESDLDPDLLERAVPPRRRGRRRGASRGGASPSTTLRADAGPRRAAAARTPRSSPRCSTPAARRAARARAMLTHRALLANIEQVAQVEPPMIHGDDVVLGVLPLFHVYGLNAVLGGVLRHRRQAGAGRAVRPAAAPST